MTLTQKRYCYEMYPPILEKKKKKKKWNPMKDLTYSF